jgi:hypothetical protein
MLTLLKSKLVLAIIGIMGIGGITATATIASAQHAGPFAINTSQHGQDDGNNTSTTPGHEFHAQGVIVSVTLAQGSTTSGTLVLRPNGQQNTVIVHFTADTHIEVSHDQNDDDSEHGTPIPAATGEHSASSLTAGLTVNVEGVVQSDGSVLAKEIQANDNGNAHDGDNGTPEANDDHGTPGPGDDHGTPEPGDDHGTPGPGDDHGTPEPHH